MMKRKFGWTNVAVPVIGQGTWKIEGSSESERLAVEALRLGLELGLTHIDTAEIYGNGRAEELVAEAIAGRRDEVFLVGKVWPANASFEGTLRAYEQSLRRLKTDRLDLYLLHWPSRYPIGETMRAMEALVARRQVRFIGVSNFGLSQLLAAQRALRNERLACNQVRYNLVSRGMERRLLPYCSKHEIAVVGYSPFRGGILPAPGSAGGRLLAEVGERQAKTPRQVVLNFLTRHPGVFIIPKASTMEHVRENAGGADWVLTNSEIAAIHRAFPIHGAMRVLLGKVARRLMRLTR